MVNPYLSLLVGALGAATIALVGGLLGAWIQSRREHGKWIREERMKAYADFMKHADEILAYFADPSPEKPVPTVDELSRALALVRLLGPHELHLAALLFRMNVSMALGNIGRTEPGPQLTAATVSLYEGAQGILVDFVDGAQSTLRVDVRIRVMKGKDYRTSLPRKRSTRLSEMNRAAREEGRASSP